MRDRVRSWGNVCGGEHEIVPLFWRDRLLPAGAASKKLLPFGTGRSYGDSCLNSGHTLVATRGLDRLLSFDPESGVLGCESGVTLDEILRFSVPRGFFLPVSLGTKLITLGGAIANDVHGKNHHRAGTFGCHLQSLELVRSDRSRRTCSPTQDRELFEATIGGLGLTGVILSAEIKLSRIPSTFLDVEMIRFRDLEEYFSLARESDEKFEHTSAWADFLPAGKNFGRGIFLRGNFSDSRPGRGLRLHGAPWTIPFPAPNWFLSRLILKPFNGFYYRRECGHKVSRRTHYDPFFFPLDVIGQWNRLYGKRGFFQYQFVLPARSVISGMEKVKEILRESWVRPFLTVLKNFGPKKSPGMLSFPMEGLTVALDFPNLGEKTRALFDRLDETVAIHGGRLYPAKDARMSAKSFQLFFPRWKEWALHVDPKFSSDFWRRVTGGEHG